AAHVSHVASSSSMGLPNSSVGGWGASIWGIAPGSRFASATIDLTEWPPVFPVLGVDLLKESTCINWNDMVIFSLFLLFLWLPFYIKNRSKTGARSKA
ncbi:hypothetical protein KZY98_14340, partial [Croceibacter atlanticus]|uniref:hypothetical protein n=1 Tax=Croceibacter atlanticus TaxID=313588 RepID=UPI001C5D3820